MARLTGSERRATNKRDPIAGLKARIARIKKNLSTARNKSAQQNLLKTLEKRLQGYQQNKNQFGNTYGNRKNSTPMGRGVSNKKTTKTPTSERDQDGNLKPGIFKETVITGKGSSKTNTTNTKVKSNTSNTSEKKESSANKEKLKSTSPNNETKEQWLKRTSNSPAAKSGMSDAQRWAARQNHLDFLARRKAKKKKKK